MNYFPPFSLPGIPSLLHNVIKQITPQKNNYRFAQVYSIVEFVGSSANSPLQRRTSQLSQVTVSQQSWSYHPQPM